MNHTPFYAKLTAVISRPLVLIAALLISMPAEIQLARASGFDDGFEYLMPLVLSLYSAASAVIAATHPRGSKGRISAIVGSGVALGMALSAQVVGHLITSGYMKFWPCPGFPGVLCAGTSGLSHAPFGVHAKEPSRCHFSRSRTGIRGRA